MKASNTSLVVEDAAWDLFGKTGLCTPLAVSVFVNQEMAQGLFMFPSCNGCLLGEQMHRYLQWIFRCSTQQHRTWFSQYLLRLSWIKYVHHAISLDSLLTDQELKEVSICWVDGYFRHTMNRESHHRERGWVRKYPNKLTSTIQNFGLRIVLAIKKYIFFFWLLKDLKNVNNYLGLYLRMFYFIHRHM